LNEAQRRWIIFQQSPAFPQVPDIGIRLNSFPDFSVSRPELLNEVGRAVFGWEPKLFLEPGTDQGF